MPFLFHQNHLRQTLRWGVLVALACWYSLACGVAATFEAVLDRPTVGVGESVGLALRFEGGSPTAVPTIPHVPGLNVQYVGPASQYTIINGRQSSSTSHNFVLSAGKEGDYTIPAVQANVDGQTLTSRPVRLKVTRTPEAEGGIMAGQIRILLPRTNVFVGEALVAEVQLLIIQGGQARQAPALTGEGVTIGKMVQDSRENPIQMGNAIYSQYKLKVPLVVVKTGDITLSAGDCVVEVRLRRRNADPFDDFFGRIETRQFSISGEPVVLHASPLPSQGRPPGFTGTVGRFAFVVDASPTNVSVGDPITLRLQVTGTGALDALHGLDIAWPGFKTYPPTAKTETSDPLGLTGTRVFEQVVVPEQADIPEVPSMLFSYFDPEERAYHTVKSPPIPLTVRPAAAAPTAPTVLANPGASASPARQDILHIKPRSGILAMPAPPLLRQRGFLAIQCVPVVAWLCLLIWRRQTDALAKDPRRQRQRQVSRLVRAGLVKLPELARQGNASEFFAEVVHLLQEQLGERLDLPATAITEAVLEEKLAPRGAPPALLRQLHELFQACNAARYSPHYRGQELHALVPQVQSVLAELQKLP